MVKCYDMNIQEVRAALEKYGQEHLLKFWADLSEAEQASYLKEISDVSLAEIEGFFTRAMENMKNAGAKLDDQMKPLPRDRLGSVTSSDPQLLEEYGQEGLRAVAAGQVGVLLLAGGQGTRLGVAYPKGMYDVGLFSRKPLYQLQAERILALEKQARVLVPGSTGQITWYIMTSEHTKGPTLDFFKKHHFFGLEERNVVMFEQGTLPCMTFDGKIIAKSKHSLAKAPDGNGGLYRALRRENILQDMEERNITLVHAYCVDNILVKMADPVFMGFCVKRGADCGAKVVEKAYPREPVGVVCSVGGIYQVVEYSEITAATAERRNADGTLTYNAGNICNHFFTLEFLKKVVSEHELELQHHVAQKKIPYVDDKGQEVTPAVPNGIKMEKFVFDVFQFAQNFAVWEVLREEDFSPLKNADGAPKDTPSTSRTSLLDLHAKWVIAAGGKFVQPNGEIVDKLEGARMNNNEGQLSPVPTEPIVACEVSPLVSYGGENLEELVKGKTLKAPVHITLVDGKPTVIESCS